MIVGRWYVLLAAVWHWYLPLCIYLTFFNFVFYLSIPFLYFSLTSIDKLDGMVEYHRGNIEGTNSSKICVRCLRMHVLCL